MTTAEKPVSVTETQTPEDEAREAHHPQLDNDTLTEAKETESSSVQEQSAKEKPRPSRRRGMTITQETVQLENETSEAETEQEEEEEEDKERDVNKTQPNIDSVVDVHSDNNIPTAGKTASDMEQVQEQIKDLLVNDVQEEGNDNDTISSLDDASSSPRSHNSTVSSLHSSASNYDLLLARLGNKNNDPVPSIQEEADEADSNSSKPIKLPEPTEKDFDWEFWSKVVSEYSSFNRVQKDMLSDHIRHGGVPPSIRGAVWQQLAKSKDAALEQQYLELLTRESIYEKAINRDLGRTFTNDEYFQNGHGREALFNIVKAYSLYDEQVGYSHGIAFIAGPLLRNMPEEEAFSVLVRLMQNYGLRYHFTTQPDHLSRRLYQLTCLIEDHLPLVHKHISAQGIHASKFATRWFVTLFAYNFPLDAVYRIYDAVLAEGLDFTFRIILVLLERFQAQILSLESEHLVHFLKSDMLSKYAGADGPGLIYDAYHVGITPRRLERLAKQYQSDAARASSEAETIETLRRQNKALSEAVRQLEKDLSDANREHHAAANELIESKMEYARLHDENDALRQQSYDLKRALETLPGEVENRVKEEMRRLGEKNKDLVQRNTKLEEQLSYLENVVIEMNAKFAESENERENLEQRLAELKKLVG